MALLRVLGYGAMIMFLPLVLLALVVKQAWEEGWTLQLFIIALIVVALYDALKPPFY